MDFPLLFTVCSLSGGNATDWACVRRVMVTLCNECRTKLLPLRKRPNRNPSQTRNLLPNQSLSGTGATAGSLNQNLQPEPVPGTRTSGRAACACSSSKCQNSTWIPRLTFLKIPKLFRSAWTLEVKKQEEERQRIPRTEKDN